MPLSGEDLDALPTIRHVRSIGTELLTRDDAALRNRILDAGEHAPHVRAEIHRAAERRQARSAGQGSLTVQLFAMPVIVDFGEQTTRAKSELELFGRDDVWATTISRIWRSSFDDQSLDIRPLPTMVHLNTTLGISPSIVHAQVFRGASVYEGRQPRPVSMCADAGAFQSAGGPVAMVYLMQAYVASPAGGAAPSVGDRVAMQAESYLRAWFALSKEAPSVRVLTPRRFYDALDEAHRAQLGHFLRWCAQHDCVHQLDLSPADEDTGAVTITGWYQRRGNPKQDDVSWSYDSTWRGQLDSKAVMRDAHAGSDVESPPPGPDRSGQGSGRDSGPLH